MPAGEARHLAPLLREAGIKENGIEVVFYGEESSGKA